MIATQRLKYSIGYLLLLGVLSQPACKGTTSSQIAGSEPASDEQPLPFAINDASILFPTRGTRDDPLPTVDLSPSSADHTFIPASIWPALAAQSKMASGVFKKTVIAIGVRLDPCFPIANPDDSRCVRQVRIIWQPSDGGDGALHSLHVLSHDDFTALQRGISRLKRGSGLHYDDRPLGVHPVLSAEGIDGPFGKGLLTLLRQRVSAKNLIGVAFFAGDFSRGAGNVGPWVFGSFIYKDGAFTPMPLPHAGDTLLTVDGFPRVSLPSKGTSPAEILKTIPAPVMTGDQARVATQFVSGTETNLADLPTAQLAKAYAYLLRIEHPNLTTVETNLCSDCHIASQQRALIEQVHPEWLKQELAERMRPTLANPFQPSLLSGSLHNFGYFGTATEPSISQRTVNETKSVVDWINQHP